jgi:glycogen synthase
MNTDRPISRVLMTTDTIGGVWTFTLELCAGFTARGVEVLLASMGAPVRPAQRRQIEALPGVTLHESTFALEWMPDPWLDVARAGEWLWSLEQDFRPDVIHLNGFAHAALPWSAPVLVTAHSCVLSWWSAVKREPIPGSWQRYEQMVRAGLHAATWITAPTRWMLEELIRNYGAMHNLSVIANGRQPLLTEMGTKEPFILSVGRIWDEAKNIGSLEPIAADLPWPVRIAGDATAPDGTQHHYAILRMLGTLSSRDLAAWYACASIYVLPARYEPFGLSILEAASARCALVLGDIPSLRELWQGAAEFVPPDDPQALRAALLGLINNPKRRDELAEAAAARACLYSADRTTQAYLDLYERLASEFTTRPGSSASSFLP